MTTVLILILAAAAAAAVLIAFRRRSGRDGAGRKSPEQDFVEAANAASKAARQSLAAARGGQLK